MKDRSQLRIVVLRVMVVSIVATLLGRLAFLQLAEGAKYRAAASSNRVRDVVTPAARGQVLDDMGRPLVTNRTALVVSVTRSILHSQPHHGRDVLARLSAVIGISPAQIELLITPCGEQLKDGSRASKKKGCWNGSPYQPVPVASYASDSPAQVAKVLRVVEHAEDFPGVQAQYEAVREYPGRTLAAHVLGYLGPLSQDDLKKAKYQGLAPGSLIGRAGVEAVYDDRLRGHDGIQRLLVDKDSTVTGTLGTTPAVSGDDLVLSIDAGVQQAAETALAQGIAQARKQLDKNRGKDYAAPKGAAIVIEANTGRVVAMASYPSYDPTLFVGGISTRQYTGLLNAPGDPLFSNTVQGLYSPGSTFKVVSTAAAVSAGYSLTARVYPCPSSFRIGTSVKNNFEGESTPYPLDFRETLIRSCDTVYYRLAVEQWLRDGGTQDTGHAAEVFAHMARAWGFGRLTGIDLPDEQHGLITDRGYKQRYWEQTKADYCAGAKRRPKGSYLQLLDQENCTDGYRYNAGDEANFVIGQGDVLVTPLQLAMAYAALVNGGTLYRPQVAKGFLSADGRTATLLPPVRVGRVPVSRSVLDYITSALEGVVRPPGTAQSAFAGFPLGQVTIGGKTGTADVLDKSPTSWFASFSQVGASRYVTVVMVPEGGTGGTTAAPIARKIWDAIFGLEGHRAVLPAGGVLPAGLPVVLSDGSIGRPGTVVPRGRALVVSSPPPSTQALGGLPGLVWSEPPRRRTS